MGKTTDAFKREIGKNIGKAVSNWVLGDAHATPYRRVDSVRQAKAEARVSLDRAKADEINARNNKIYRDQMFSLDAAVLKNVDAVANIKVPNNKEDLMDLMSELSTHLSANQWYSGNDDESKIRNKFCDALFNKYSYCLKKLQTIDNSEYQLFYFESVARKAKRNRFWHLNKSLIGLLGLITLLCLFFFGMWYAEDRDAFPLTMLLIFGIAGLLVFIVVMIVLIVRCTKHKKLKLLRLPKPYCHEQSSLDHLENDNEVNAYDIKIESEPIIVNLNEHNRIETVLASIWNKYDSSVDMEIIGRRPIFSSEGIHNSILFVGVNPSYIPEDDNVLRKTKNGKALYYGNQYRVANAPLYFKELEKFSNRIGLPYTHVNLLYARENNRDRLLSEDSDFIREQLELTYETILQINPVAIIFFSKYAHRLIFGKDRWVDPDNIIHGNHYLKGTSIPVFFSDDIMEMTSKACNILYNNICKIIK